LITYGLNSKASITASSIQQDIEKERIVQCCLQRELITLSGKLVDPGEFTVLLPLHTGAEVYSALGAITAALLNDVELEDKKILLKKNESE
jgi:UDP-N-acetylmuramoyl-L-alanyl-D-glutamate--2,6-diaminopimelate ligase